MARPKIKKIIDILPLYAYFKPQGIPMTKLKVTALTLEEIEALKLKDIQNLEQAEAAKKMGISRSTFQRIIKSARYKLADAVIEGKALKVEGGHYIPSEKVIEKQCLMGRHHYYVKKDGLNNGENDFFSVSNMVCPECGERIIDIEKENFKNNKKGKTMKICITSTGTTLSSSVDPRFGRCPYFIIYDLEQNTFEAIENSSRDAMGGAGIQAGQTIASKNVGAVLSGSFGPNAFRVLQAANIKTYSGVSGTVREAVEQYKKGQLTETSAPDVKAHYGMGRNS
ncbi:MAG: hypothetical protein BWY60_00322 [Actinobacteria bacterium ADurb.Bin346]|nr:MAG: hypothetical protein BWY60_00322 [Actinobacteria bacterium ADurb.Bin346]